MANFRIKVCKKLAFSPLLLAKFTFISFRV
nr:MAG TPA: exoribonuclease [Caudoviricetes sp.]